MEWINELKMTYEKALLDTVFIPVFGKDISQIPGQLNMSFNDKKKTQSYGELFSSPESYILNNLGYYVDNRYKFLHFTSLENCKKIIESKSLRMSNLNKLNDKQELSYAGCHLRFNDEDYKKMKQEIYVFSMCNYYSDNPEIETNLNNLDLWERYGRRGTGVAIELSPFPENNLKWRNFYIGDVKYGEENSSTFKKLMGQIDEFNKNHPPIYYQYMFYKLLCYHKHPIWSGEKETRIVYQRLVSPSTFQSTEGETIFPKIVSETDERKYLELPLPIIEDGSYSKFTPIELAPMLYIKNIFIGPNVLGFYNEKQEIETLMQQNLGYKAKVIKSDIDKYINY